jgi:hypothetical protein
VTTLIEELAEERADLLCDLRWCAEGIARELVRDEMHHERPEIKYGCWADADAEAKMALQLLELADRLQALWEDTR